ncbi:YihY/virulence factor BrkB family protein [Salinigranum sp.]|uniref:YihY/virulence factor BrkB family protein n=1 Tax=Salinigranum sp. TaxID=1966351 RepID=UPI0035667040
MQRLSDSVDIGKQVTEEFTEKNVSFMAAGIAYNAFVSLAPLLVLLLLVASIVGGGLQSRLVTVAEASLPRPIADAVGQIFAADTATGVSVVGLVVLLWGTLKIFRGLDTAFSEIYETDEGDSFVDQLVDGSVVLVSLVVSVVATVAVTTLFSAVESRIPLLGTLTPVVLAVGLVVAFTPMYYRFPDAELGWRDVLPGTVVAALGWTALQGLFQVYLLFKSGGSGGFFGGVILVVTWLYFSGLVLLVGAVLNAVVSGHASGAAGGVGRGAADGDTVETRSERSLGRVELAAYLGSLREQLTGCDTATGPTGTSGPDGRGGNDPTPPTHRENASPEEVEVVEATRTEADGGGRERTVTLRWWTDGPADD